MGKGVVCISPEKSRQSGRISAIGMVICGCVVAFVARKKKLLAKTGMPSARKAKRRARLIECLPISTIARNNDSSGTK